MLWCTGCETQVMVSGGLEHEQCDANAEDACVQPVLLLAITTGKGQAMSGQSFNIGTS